VPQVLEFATDDPIAARLLQAMYHAATPTAAAPSLCYGLFRSRAGGYVAASPERPLLVGASLTDAWAYLEWRATEDLLNAPSGGAVFLHAAGAEVGDRLVLLVGDSGAGKSTLVAHLMLRGHRMLGDDLVRFAPQDGSFSAVGRSVKLDANALKDMPLISSECAASALGTLLASGCYYVSPAAIRRDWQASQGRPWAVVLLDAAARAGPAGLVRSSDGEAAVYVTQKVLGRGDGAEVGAARSGDVIPRLLESLAEAAAYRAAGHDPAAVAEALETEALR
jgi:hypothetical protein